MLAFRFVPAFFGLFAGLVELAVEVFRGLFRILSCLFRFFRRFVSCTAGLPRRVVGLPLPILW